jgi:hypothetical protein
MGTGVYGYGPGWGRVLVDVLAPEGTDYLESARAKMQKGEKI